MKAQLKHLKKTIMTPNFSWLIPDKIAGSGQIGGFYPESQQILISDLWELKELGIGAVVSLTEQSLVSSALTTVEWTTCIYQSLICRPLLLKRLKNF